MNRNNYNRIAGQSVERLAALSDGVFAVAMTLLVLDLHAPAASVIHGEHDLWRALVALTPRLVMYLMSFLTLGIFWVGQQTQLNHLARSNRDLTWIHIAFLFAVALTPFSTTLLAEFFHYRLALVVYWANLLLLGVVLYASWGYAVRHRLLKEDIAPEVPAASAAASSSPNPCTPSARSCASLARCGVSPSSSSCNSIMPSRRVCPREGMNKPELAPGFHVDISSPNSLSYS